ncbi:coiled-coil domain-containing protein 141 isoform X2 [Protopterus annectens]|uniref:coiled-coil domain-containing protein 141 isoform X2 n=1 Tax=Protopterus annectens TaxID=7888 RepID=UPI001CFC08E1|nr:coiled-coil domain-containing protein 141 isoform X2 [Protopterus annectens]
MAALSLIIQSGTCVSLQLVECTPNILEIGSSQDEIKKQLQDHEMLLIKLKGLEHGIWDLFRDADKKAQKKNKDQKLVYDAMGKTLGASWELLLSLLEKRKELLNLAAEFFDRALEFAVKIDETEDVLHHGQVPADTESLKEYLQRHCSLNKDLLENSLVVLNKSQELIDFIQEFQSEESIIYSKITEGAQNSCMKIESLLEVLQDRRRLLVNQLRQQQMEMEQLLKVCQWDQRQGEVFNWFKEHGETYLVKNHLGSSLSENEMLLAEYKDFVYKAKHWSSVAEKLKVEAYEILLPDEFTDKDHVISQSQKLKTAHEEFWLLMEDKQILLQEANEFFNSANKAFDELGNIEAHLKVLGLESLSLTALAKEHETLQRKIKDVTADALQKGQALLSKADCHRFHPKGIQEMIGYIQKRVDQLNSHYNAHHELAMRKQQLLSSFDDQADKVSTYVQKCTALLATVLDPGVCLSESKGVLETHLQLSQQLKIAENDFKAASDIIIEMNKCEASETAACVNKTDLLNEKLKTQSRRLTERLDILNNYVEFLKSSEELEEAMLVLEESCKMTSGEEGAGGKAASISDEIDSKWQAVLGTFIVVQDLASSFRTVVDMMSENLNINVEMALKVVENILEKLTAKKIALSNVWSSWHLRGDNSKSAKKQWKKVKDQIKKVVQTLKILETELMLATKVDIGEDLQTVLALMKKFNQQKSQFLKLNAEVEFIMKMSELLSVQGIPVKDKREKTSELLSANQSVKDMIKQYKTLCSTALRFHHITQELESIMTSVMQRDSVPGAPSPDADDAKVQLTHHQEQRIHIQNLYSQALTLGADLISKVQHSKSFNASKKHLQQKLDALQADSVKWSASADKYEDKLSANVHECTVKEELNEMKESFKELRKRFNNFKFNYMKKTEKTRNLKAVKSQAQQVDIYYEKIQAFKKKMNQFETKITDLVEYQSEDKAISFTEAIKELQNQVNEFNRSVEEYKQNLDSTVLLQQSMEECQFWCEETSATVARVGKYSADCNSQEAVAMLYKQFEKFVCPTVPQQEERIQQITELAIRLHGPVEGKKFIEKMVAKHYEILESVKGLSNSLKQLELKLKAESSDLTENADIVESSPAKASSANVSTDVRSKITEKITEKEGNQAISLSATVNQMGPHDTSYVTGLSKQDITEVEKGHLLEQSIPKPNWKSTMHQQFSSYTKSILHAAQTSELGRKFGAFHHNKNRPKDMSFSLLSSPKDVTEIPSISILSQIPVEQFRTKESEEMFHSTGDMEQNVIQQEIVSEHEEITDTLMTDSTGNYCLTHLKADTAASAAEASTATERDFQNEMTIEEMSADEYECASPDDISLPPLPETPESSFLQYEAELEERPCISSHSLHDTSCSPQTQITSSSNMQINCSAAAYTNAFNTYDQGSIQPDSCSAAAQSIGPKFRSESSSFIRSPLTVLAPSITSNSLSQILKLKPETESSVRNSLYEVHETHLQHYIHESVTEMQEPLHGETSTSLTHSTKMHASLDALTAFVAQRDHTSHSKQMADKEMITCSTESKAAHSLTGLAPSFSKLLSNATVLEGSPVTLEVEISGFPEPTLTWYKNGEKLTSNTHLQLSKKERKHTVFIHEVCDKDAGQYVVWAQNSSGSLSSSAVLQVQVQGKAPTFEAKFTDVTLLLGEDLILECTLSGRPKPQVIWMKDDIIMASSESAVQVLSDTHVFIKRSVVLADSGNYICIARNEAGVAYCSAYIDITGHNTNGEMCAASIGKLNRNDCSHEQLKSAISAATEETGLEAYGEVQSLKATQLSLR